jgi:hypothetical protein
LSNPRRPGKAFRPSRRYQEAILADKRNKMLTMWVTEDEHRRLLERCDGKQLAAWMRQTCLDEKPTRAGRLPRFRRRCCVSLPAWAIT